MRCQRYLDLDGVLSDRLFELAAQTPTVEICGFLLGDHETGRATTIHPIRNIAHDPSQEYEMDPAVVRDLWRNRRHLIVGTYHSHPHGIAVCSRRDRQLIRHLRLCMAIISPSTGEIRVYGLWTQDTVMELQKIGRT